MPTNQPIEPQRCCDLKGGALFLIAAVALSISGFGGTCPAQAEDMDLMETVIARSALLNNNLSPFEPRWERGPEGEHLSFGFGVEKKLSENLGFDLNSEWDRTSPRGGHSSSGLGNVEIGLTYVFLHIPQGGFQFAISPSVSFPTNAKLGADRSYTQSGGALAWGGRLSDFPNRGWRKYLRAIEIQGDIGFSRTFGGDNGYDFFFDPEIDYSMPFLNQSTDGAVLWMLRYLTPFAELNFDRVVGQGPNGPLTVFLFPGLTFTADKFRVAVGAQLAMNHEAARNQQVAAVVSVLVFLDQVDRRFGWTPL